MASVGDEESWAGKVRRQVGGIVRNCSSKSNEGTWVHPDGAMPGSKVGDVPDEPRQWCAFEYADLMEQGQSGGITASFIELPKEEVRLCVERSPDRKEFLLTTNVGTRLLLARFNSNSEGFDIFVTSDGQPPRALGPAFTLVPNRSKDRWTLHAKICDHCECRGKRICGSRELAYISHHKEDVGQGQVYCLDMEIPEVSPEGEVAIWCPVCKNQDTDQPYQELCTRMPKWNARRKTLSLDFFGRCSLASSKNFQLQKPDCPDQVKLLYGKVGDNQFVLDYHRPLGMIQAFAAAVSTNVWK